MNQITNYERETLTFSRKEKKNQQTRQSIKSLDLELEGFELLCGDVRSSNKVI
jgi:hypothetical protein